MFCGNAVMMSCPRGASLNRKNVMFIKQSLTQKTINCSSVFFQHYWQTDKDWYLPGAGGVDKWKSCIKLWKWFHNSTNVLNITGIHTINVK